MRVVLQAESGRRSGHRIWLGANQRVFVGGNEWAEFSHPGDPELADVQFVVESDYQNCHIRNLFAGQPLTVNGQEVHERTLVNGDIVTAGNTRFRVGIQESAESQQRQAAIGGDTLRPGSIEVPYLVERCESGLFRFYASDASQTPTDVALYLSQQHCFYLIVHLTKAGVELPPDLTRVVDLGARGEVGADQVNACSMLMISPTDPIDRFRLLEEGWNRDSVLGVFTTRERPGVIKALIRANLWVFPAHMVRDQLADGAPEYIHELFRGIKAVLLPSNAPGGWEVFANSETDPLWMQLGFPNAPLSMNKSFAPVSAPPKSTSAGSARPGSVKPGSNRPGTKKNARPA
ncbi:MAG: hypothetical protein HY290_14295 [Planctomycetia bacterium]|nr:hypothetical protein [Planctomycetia bacterium]